MLHLTRNIPLKKFYSAFRAEIIQTTFTNSKCKKFGKTSKNLILIMSKQGGDTNVSQEHLEK